MLLLYILFVPVTENIGPVCYLIVMEGSQMLCSVLAEYDLMSQIFNKQS